MKQRQHADSLLEAEIKRCLQCSSAQLASQLAYVWTYEVDSTAREVSAGGNKSWKER